MRMIRPRRKSSRRAEPEFLKQRASAVRCVRRHWWRRPELPKLDRFHNSFGMLQRKQMEGTDPATVGLALETLPFVPSDMRRRFTVQCQVAEVRVAGPRIKLRSKPAVGFLRHVGPNQSRVRKRNIPEPCGSPHVFPRSRAVRKQSPLHRTGPDILDDQIRLPDRQALAGPRPEPSSSES